MPIPNRTQLITDLQGIITSQLTNFQYRGGPSLHFYHRVRAVRQQHPSISSFLADNSALELVYATLVAWDMDGRGAKLQDYGDFCKNLRGAGQQLQAVEVALPNFTWTSRTAMISALESAYDSLTLMETNGRLVSNSKCLHFLFPAVCMPMDRRNTLTKIYGNGTYESKHKFLELINLAYDVVAGLSNPSQYHDTRWNTCDMKLVDNAIIIK